MRYLVYEAIDPEELIVGGNYDGTLLWRRHRPEYVEIDDGLCGSCNIVTFARQFLMRGNLPLFRRLHRSGIIYTVDRDLTPWGAVTSTTWRRSRKASSTTTWTRSTT